MSSSAVLVMLAFLAKLCQLLPNGMTSATKRVRLGKLRPSHTWAVREIGHLPRRPCALHQTGLRSV